MARPAFVYLLRCADGSLYCGWTFDLPARVAAHAAGTGARYTRSRRPLELAAAWEVEGATAARRLEARIKGLQRRAKEAIVAGAPPPLPVVDRVAWTFGRARVTRRQPGSPSLQWTPRHEGKDA